MAKESRWPRGQARRQIVDAMNAAVKAAHEAIDRKDVRAYWRHVASYSLLQGMVRDWRHVVLSEIRTLPGPPRLDFVDRLRVGLDDLYRAFK